MTARAASFGSSSNHLTIPALHGRVLMDATDDAAHAEEDFEDVRCELFSIGHHLTSVLINPRETLFDDLFDEFALDQSAPLEYQSPLSQYSSSFFTSSHSSAHTTTATSLHSSSSGNNQLVLTLTQTELAQIEKLTKRLKKLWETYMEAHPPHLAPSMSQGNLLLAPPSLVSSPTLSRTKRLAADELRICYREVPEVFFRKDFSLQNEDIFNQTLALLDNKPSSSNSPRAGHLGHNQDRLTSYLDHVEVALLRQIWARSPAFFRALDDLKGLQYVVHETTDHLRSVRGGLQEVGEELSHAICIPTLQRRQHSLSALQSQLLAMQQVLAGRRCVLQLLEAEDFYSAQELVVGLQQVYLQQLQPLSSMRLLGEQLAELDNAISDVICNKFVTMGIQWEASSSSIGDGDYLAELDRDLAFPVMSLALPEAKEEELLQLLQSLVVTHKLQQALSMYRSRLLEGVKLVIRTCVMEFLSPMDLSLGHMLPEEALDELSGLNTGQDSNTVPYIQRVREMGGEAFLACVSMCYEQLQLSLQKASLFHTLIVKRFTVEVEVAAEDKEEEDDFKFAPFNSTNTPLAEKNKAESKVEAALDKQSCESYIALSKQCLQAACDVAQKSMAQLINIRKEPNAKLSCMHMRSLWEVSLAFVVQVEKHNQQQSAFALRNCLLIQYKLFVEALHEGQKTQLVNTLDAERWVQCDVSAERQHDINRLTSGKSFLSSAGGQEGTGASASAASHADVSRRKEARAVLIESVEYKVTWSALLLAEVVMTYLDIAHHFSPIQTELIGKIVELIRLLNTRTKQLVLGAQAIQSAARLKSITAKHLGITAQSLSFLIAVLPHVRAALLALLPPKHHLLLTELDRMSQELFDHHHQIINKFVSIVSDMVEHSALKLRQIDWDRSLAHAHASPSHVCEYFEEISKNSLTLHKVLNAILPSEQITDIFMRIFNLLNRKISAHFEEVMPSTGTGKQRILDEIAHLVVTLSKLKHVDTTVLTSQLEDHFRKKYAMR